MTTSKHKRPTIFDLERVAGFSRGTISRAFNESSEISAETRTFILKCAAELGYSPHPGARNIKSGLTRRWGLLLPHLRNPYYAELAECIDLEARKRKTPMLLGLSHYDPVIEVDLVRHWAAGETDGMIIDMSDPEVNTELFEQLRVRGLPLVFLHRSPVSEEFDLVVSDSEECFKSVMQNLLSLGHRRIAYIGMSASDARLTDSFTKYQEVLVSQGLFDDDLVYWVDYGSKSVAAGWEQWRRSSSPPTAVVCFNDYFASGIIEAARASGLVLPRDLSVIGRDDIAEAARLGLTTIQNDRAAMAREAFALLERRLQNPGAPREKRKTPSRLITRESVAPPPEQPVAQP